MRVELDFTEFFKQLATGKTVNDACAASGFTYPLVSDLRKINPEFSAAYQAAYEAGGVRAKGKKAKPVNMVSLNYTGVLDHLAAGKTVNDACALGKVPYQFLAKRRKDDAEFNAAYEVAYKVGEVKRPGRGKNPIDISRLDFSGFLDHLAAGKTVAIACNLSNVSYSNITKRRKDDAEFNAAYDTAYKDGEHRRAKRGRK